MKVLGPFDEFLIAKLSFTSYTGLFFFDHCEKFHFIKHSECYILLHGFLYKLFIKHPEAVSCYQTRLDKNLLFEMSQKQPIKCVLFEKFMVIGAVKGYAVFFGARALPGHKSQSKILMKNRLDQTKCQKNEILRLFKHLKLSPLGGEKTLLANLAIYWKPLKPGRFQKPIIRSCAKTCHYTISACSFESL